MAWNQLGTHEHVGKHEENNGKHEENMARLVSAQFHQWFGFSFTWRWVKPTGSYWPLHGVLRCAHPQITPKASVFFECTFGYNDFGELWGCSRSGHVSDVPWRFDTFQVAPQSMVGSTIGVFHKIIVAENPGAKNALIKWKYFPKGKGIILYQDPTESQFLMIQYNVVKSPLFTH